MPEVDLYAWNPRKSEIPWRLQRQLSFTVGRRPNNFGDLLGPVIVRGVLARRGIDPSSALRDARLLSIGSVLHHAHDGDVVWGTGINGKQDPTEHLFANLDVRAVRGPLTRAFLADQGINAPEIFGDPGLLLPEVRPDLLELAAHKSHEITIVPNLNDLPRLHGTKGSRYRGVRGVLDPRRPLDFCLNRIARSEFVIGSSLHGVVVAESLGIPARLVRPSKEEHVTKYHDYLQGTGRTDVTIADSMHEAISMGGQTPPVFDRDGLLASFPTDLWRAESDG